MKLEEIPLDDAKTYSLLSSGDTLACFQIDGKGMQGLLKKVQPTSINDISAVLALYRPGPLDNGSHTAYANRKRSGSGHLPDIHPELDAVIEPVLKETYGIIVYQEQVLAIIKEVTGWDLGEAELIFEAMRKKKTDKMVAALPGFRKAAMARGYSEDSVSALWDVLVPFSDYSFNKAHSIAYAHISYWTAYLKANHPVEYMTAVLTGETDPDKMGEYLDEITRMGIDLRPPDINGSDLGFSFKKEGSILYGLASIKGCGESATKALLSGRPYSGIDDFFRRASAKVLNAGVLKALIESGCLDSLWQNREGLLQEAPELARMALEHRAAARKGARGLIRPVYEPGYAVAEDYTQRKAWEAERLGISVSTETIILRITRELTDAETTWMVRQLLARPGRDPVDIESFGIRASSGIKCSRDGLEEAMLRIGVVAV